MANTIVTMQNIAREVLIQLKENLIMPATINKSYSNDFINKGDTIQVEKPAVFVADEFGETINLQDVTESSVTVKMDTIADVSFAVTAKEKALSMPNFSTKYLKSAAQAIAEKVNQDGLSLYKDVPYFYGTAGTTPDALADIAGPRGMLNNQKAPMMDRNFAWSPDAETKLIQLDAIVNADKSGSTAALRAGAIGDVYGFTNYMSQAVKTHTAGGYTALDDVDITSGALGATSVKMESTAGASTAKLLKGDLFTVDGYQYVVTEDTAAAVSGDIAVVNIYPGLHAAFGDLDDATVTFADESAGAHVANMAYQKDAFLFVTRPLDDPSDAGVKSYVARDEASGLALRVTEAYDISTKKTTISIDMLYEYVTAYPELAVTVLG